MENITLETPGGSGLDWLSNRYHEVYETLVYLAPYVSYSVLTARAWEQLRRRCAWQSRRAVS